MIARYSFETTYRNLRIACSPLASCSTWMARHRSRPDLAKSKLRDRLRRRRLVLFCEEQQQPQHLPRSSTRAKESTRTTRDYGWPSFAASWCVVRRKDNQYRRRNGAFQRSKRKQTCACQRASGRKRQKILVCCSRRSVSATAKKGRVKMTRLTQLRGQRGTNVRAPEANNFTTINTKYFACTNAVPCTTTRPLKTLIKTPTLRRI